MKIAQYQTYRNGRGDRVHVTGERKQTRFVVRNDADTLRYAVDANGKVDERYYKANYNLIEQIPRVYIAGPMSGHDDLNFPAFHAAAKLYRDRGCFVINPAELNGGEDEAALCKGMTVAQLAEHWRECMRKDIAELVTCEMIVLLPMWQMSKGASLEKHVAEALGLTISYLDN